ncbi:DUF3093 domain-containing protein [Streptomyces buecherae]|uniref:DUF3093 domain-containing protein n=1 Tax=Streptomyces buecherae TaxID=2763006 RepID=A0A7G8K691_9ACTN|nr:DUF3093 domain-containing protein [Streptomyces buecherae]MBC3986503.1 DUF3093 domain-containing protein [Streptomyces buecherae]MBC3989064.1 DUF3093 domain-containing protein [Streptomyces buecherae]QKW53969.1 DUF3093 domain-containing protein [Streptomyces buecherae]QNJ38574.1 DUF3093 domain-containing protein [Streptomyces buecherae]
MSLYDERLSVPPAWWLWVPLPGLALALVLLPFGVPAALGALLLVSCAAAAGTYAYGRSRIKVTIGSLTAGKIRLPIDVLGMPEILDPEEALAWRTRRADAHALMLLRSHVPTALRIEITAPDYRAPYLYLSTRQPHTLVAVLAFAKR